MQESTQQANFHITVYMQAVPGTVRSAHSRVVEQISMAAVGMSGPGLDPDFTQQPVSC